MQHLSDNSDELFRRAASDYPLITNSNWDDLAAKLKSTSEGSAEKKNRKWFYTSVFLVAVIALIIGIVGYEFNNVATKPTSVSANTIKPSKKTQPYFNKNNSTPNLSATNNVENKNNQNLLLKNCPSKILTQNFSTKKAHLESTAFNNYKPQSNDLIRKNDLFNSSRNSIGNNELIHNNKEFYIAEKSKVPLNTYKENNKIVVSQLKLNSFTNNTSSATQTHIKLTTKPKTIYGGIFVGPQFSTVKLNKFANPGYNVGLQIGYRISKRISIESGVERNKENFYSDGDDFDKSKLKLKPTTIINSVNGNAKLTDVPVNLHYNFTSNANNHFFVAAGTNALLITHTENYDYQVSKNGLPANIKRRYNSHTSTQYLNDINLSAGYETPLKIGFKLRVEPYYHLPLKGLGIGSVPVSSIGLNVGVIKELK